MLPRSIKSHKSSVRTAAQLLPQTMNIYMIVQRNTEILSVSI